MLGSFGIFAESAAATGFGSAAATGSRLGLLWAFNVALRATAVFFGRIRGFAGFFSDS
jgi:hypothetical protein